MALEDEGNPYELLEVGIDSTEQEIRTAYRQRSLKVHPDKNRNNPDAARKFHELNQAYELLVDPLRRLALDAKLRLKEAQKARRGKYDAKRKMLVEELEERERALKKSKTDQMKAEAGRLQETERIREEGRRMREARERELLQAEEEAKRAAEEREKELAPPPLGTHDTTIRLKYDLTKHPTLTTAEALSALLSPFGETDTQTIVISLKPPKKAPHKPPKHGTALVPFKKIGDAFGAVCASGQAERGLEGIEVAWAEGKEPPILGWLRKLGKLDVPTVSQGTSAVTSEPDPKHEAEPRADTSSRFSTFPESLPDPSRFPNANSAPTVGVDYESLTLMRLRQAERARLEREIREQEGDG